MQRQQITEIDEALDGVFQSCEAEDGVTFSKGNMLVHGEAQVPVEAVNWRSSGNNLTTYTTVKWEDPVTKEKRVSCNCPGWGFKKKGKERSCKHTKDMTGEATCNAERVDVTQIHNISTAETVVPNFEGRRLRGIMLD